jgi:hypothetical protein
MTLLCSRLGIGEFGSGSNYFLFKLVDFIGEIFEFEIFF